LMPPHFTWRNTEFHLYESVSGKKGVSYHIKHTWPLAKLFDFKSV
jgi:2'-5' RNA ligase